MIAAAHPHSNKGQKFPPEVLTPDEVQQLMAACSRRGSCGIRNRALICLLWRAGLRISEGLALKPKDIDHDAGSIRVLHGKGDRFRTVGIDPNALTVLDTWLVRRKELGLNGRHTIFCTLKGRPLDSSYMRKAIRTLGRKADIEKRTHAHGLRHTFAAELRSENVDIGIISKQLGHASIATTSRYLDHVNPAAVIETINARKW
jgi:integrase/recombinase XerD